MKKVLRSSEIQVPELGKTEIWKITTKFNTTFQHLEYGDGKVFFSGPFLGSLKVSALVSALLLFKTAQNSTIQGK